LERVVGSKELQVLEPIKVNENLLINIGTARSLAIVKSVKKDEIELDLKIPVCAEEGEKAVISRQIAGRWRLIGYGKIK